MAHMAKQGGNHNENLRPVRTKEEARARGRNGGIASGKSKRRKASLLRCAQMVLEADITPAIKSQIEKITGEIDDENDTLFTAAAAVIMKEAISGNVQAFRELKDIVKEIDGLCVEDEEQEDELSRALRELGEIL